MMNNSKITDNFFLLHTAIRMMMKQPSSRMSISVTVVGSGLNDPANDIVASAAHITLGLPALAPFTSAHNEPILASKDSLFEQELLYLLLCYLRFVWFICCSCCWR